MSEFPTQASKIAPNWINFKLDPTGRRGPTRVCWKRKLVTKAWCELSHCYTDEQPDDDSTLNIIRQRTDRDLNLESELYANHSLSDLGLKNRSWWVKNRVVGIRICELTLR